MSEMGLKGDPAEQAGGFDSYRHTGHFLKKGQAWPLRGRAREWSIATCRKRRSRSLHKR
jgi:hypothetical protein